MRPHDLASELARVAHEIDGVGDLDRSRYLQLAIAVIGEQRREVPSGDALRGEALDLLLARLKSASQQRANNEGAEVAMLLLDAALAIRTVLGARHESAAADERAGAAEG